MHPIRAITRGTAAALLTALLLPGLALADDPPPHAWTDVVGSRSIDVMTSVAFTPSGGIVAAGRVSGRLPGERDLRSRPSGVAVRRYAPGGRVLWTRTFGTGYLEEDVSVAAGPGGGVWVSGTTNGDFPGIAGTYGHDGFVRRYGPTGRVRWTRQIGTDSDTRILGISVDGRGNAYVVGGTYGSIGDDRNAGRMDVLVMKLSPQGRPRWARLIGGPGGDVGRMTLGADGALYLAIETSDGIPGITDPVRSHALLRMDTGGAIDWAREILAREDLSIEGVAADPRGGVVVVGTAYSGVIDPIATDRAGLIVDFGPDGERRWARQFESHGRVDLLGVAARGSTIVVAGETDSSLADQPESWVGSVFVRALDLDGRHLWTATFADDRERGDLPGVSGIALGPDGAVALVGGTAVPLQGQRVRGDYTDLYLGVLR